MFYGRTKQLNVLNEKYETKRKQFGVIYGRYKNGKTEMIKEFIKGKAGLYFPAGDVTDDKYLANFSGRLNSLLKSPSIFPYISWERALATLESHYSGSRYYLIIDDYPCIASRMTSFASILQAFYDHAGDNLFLIIIGDDRQFMRGEIKDCKAPLYWRQTFEMHLDKMTIGEAALFLKDCSVEDKLNYMSLMSSYPFYLEAINKGRGFEWNVSDLLFSECGEFANLPDKFITGLDGEREIYNKILLSSATGNTSISQLVDKTGENAQTISGYISTLVDAEIMRAEDPFVDKSYPRRYVITDPLVRFWYAIVFPNANLPRESGEIFFDSKKDEIYSCLDRGVEDVATMYLDEMNADGRLGDLFPHVRKFSKYVKECGRTIEIDGLARSGNNFLVFDCLCARRPYGARRLSHLMEDAAVLTEMYGDALNLQYYIFSRNNFEDDFPITAAVHCITPEDIFNL